MVQTTAMDWILNFLDFAQTTVVAFTPRIVQAVLPNLASTK
jgi:vacuole morphology and inheritance protein 14